MKRRRVITVGFTMATMLVAAPGLARDRDGEDDARVRNERGMVGDAAYGFRGHTRAGERASTPDGIFTFSAESRGMLTSIGHVTGPAIGVDLELGAAPPFLFTYRLHLQPLGWGVALGTRGSWITTAGFGIGGITAAQTAALELPVASRIAFDVSDRARVLLDARALATPTGRDHNRALVGDETRIGIGVRIGRAWHDYSMSDAGGYFFRLERSERLGTTYVGLVVGFELGMAM